MSELIVVQYDPIQNKLLNGAKYKESFKEMSLKLCELTVKYDRGFLQSPSLDKFKGNVFIDNNRVAAPLEYWQKLKELEPTILNALKVYRQSTGSDIWKTGSWKVLKLSI